jgi:hypothetical protein
MFNGGRGRIYASAANTKDILNLRGVDVATMGAIKTGTVKLEKTQSGAQAGDVKNKDIGNLSKDKKGTPKTNPAQPNVDPGSYVENVISMIIDS